MRFIKKILFVFLIPVTGYGQTIHVDSNRIVYKGTIHLDHITKNQLYATAKYVIQKNIKGAGEIIEDSEKEMISANGSIRLASPYSIIKTVEYILELSVDDGKYKYRIDSVYIKEVERGGKTTKISSENLVKGMDVSGPVAANAEKQLNEIGMKFQKVVDVINTDMKKMVDAKNPSN